MPKTNKVEDRVGRAPRGAWLLMYLSVCPSMCVCVCSNLYLLCCCRLALILNRGENSNNNNAKTRKSLPEKFYRAWQGTNSSWFLVFFIIFIELYFASKGEKEKGKYAQLLSEKTKQKEKMKPPSPSVYIDKVERNLFNLLAD